MSYHKLIKFLRCEGTKSGRHEWRPGQWDDAREKVWCCRCARLATDIVDAATFERTGPLRGIPLDDDGAIRFEGGASESAGEASPDSRNSVLGGRGQSDCDPGDGRPSQDKVMDMATRFAQIATSPEFKRLSPIEALVALAREAVLLTEAHE